MKKFIIALTLCAPIMSMSAQGSMSIKNVLENPGKNENPPICSTCVVEEGVLSCGSQPAIQCPCQCEDIYIKGN